MTTEMRRTAVMSPRRNNRKEGYNRKDRTMKFDNYHLGNHIKASR